MAKLSLTDLANLQNETTAVNAINANNAATETALENTLSRDGTSPNQMDATLDMNSHDIINLPAPVSDHSPIRLIDVNTINNGGITVSPLPVGGTSGQVLSKRSSTNFDTQWSTLPTDVTPEQFGYTNYGGADASTAITAAINSVAGGVNVVFGPHTYVISAPIVINKWNVSFSGSGPSTVLQFGPAANNQTMVTWNMGGGNELAFGGMRNLTIYSTNTIDTKTAINTVDCSSMIFENIKIFGTGLNGTWSGGGNSVGLQTNGRDLTTFRTFHSYADIPIRINKNPNVYLSCDHHHYSDCYLIANNNPCIWVEDGAILTNLTFDGYQAWVTGTHGFFMQDTTSTASNLNNVSFNNVRSEQGTNPAGFTFNLDCNPSNPLRNVSIRNCYMDPGRQGILARGIKGLHLDNIMYVGNGTTATTAYNVNSTVSDFTIENCRWEATTLTINNPLVKQLGFTGTAGTSTLALPTAYYSNNTDGPSSDTPITAKSFKVNQTNALSSWLFDATSNVLVMTNGQVSQLPDGAGLLLLREGTTNFTTGLYLLGSGVNLLGNSVGAIFVAGAPAGGKIGVTGTGPYFITNNIGSTITLGVTTFKSGIP